MASSDEEDLEALRNAALASLRQKQAAQAPQGIQVLNLSALQSSNQYQQVAAPAPHPEVDYGYSDFGEVPFEFQQAVLQQQTRGRGWGFHRGRGRGRGRGNWFPPKPVTQSALIVIQPSKGEEEAPKVPDQPKDSRPFLMRPQDKWASTESGSQSSTPTRPKEKSKFSRYNDESDSEDDDEIVGRRRRKSESSNLANMSLEDVSSDTKVEVHSHNNNDKHEYVNEVEIHNNELDANMTEEVHEKDSEFVYAEESAVDMSQNITIDEITSDKNLSLTVEKSAAEIVINAGSFGDQAMNVKAHPELKNVDANTVGENIIMTQNKFLDGVGDQGVESDNTPLRDEQTPLRDELRQDDSISYSTFSRFNRRNRDSDSAEESGEESDSCQKNESSSSKDSSVSRDSEGSQVESGNESGENESVIDDEIEFDNEIPKLQQTNSAKISHSPQERKSPIQSLKSSKSSDKTSSSSNSDSDSDSESFSSSQSSFSSGSVTSDTSSRKIKQKLQGKRESKAARSRSKSPEESRKKSNFKSECEKMSTMSNRRLRVTKDDEYSTSDRNKKDYNIKKNRIDLISNEKRRTNKDLTPYMQHKKPVKDRVADVKADPEFDATNYRDESLYKRNDRKGKHSNISSEFDKKHYTDRDQRNRGKSKEKVEKNDKIKSRDKIEKTHVSDKDKDKRYFEEISRLKMEEARMSRKNIDEKGSESSARLKDSKSEFKQHRAHSVERKSDKMRSSEKTNRKDVNAKCSKSDSVIVSRNAKKSQSSTKESLQHISKERQKSYEKFRQYSTDRKSEKQSKKTDKKSKGRSIEDRLKRIANVTENLDSDSDSDKSVSSLSDVTSDSETETWRDKKHGASRKTADIEMERRRRELKEREKIRGMERTKGEKRHERGEGDCDISQKERYKEKYSKGTKYESEFHELQSLRKDNNRDRRNHDEKERQRYYHKKKMVFYEEKNAVRKQFEEASSDSDTGRKGGLISVVRNERTKHSEEIPSLLNINVSKPKDRKIQKKLPKKESLIIHVEKSSDEEVSSTKSRKKKVKKRKRWSSSDEDEASLQQVVNVTFNDEQKSRTKAKSVYERLGIVKSKKSVSSDSKDTGEKRSRDVSIPSDGKRIKLTSTGKYLPDEKSKKSRAEKSGDPDDVLNLRIQKIQEKNAEILRRKMEVEQDKKKYG